MIITRTWHLYTCETQTKTETQASRGAIELASLVALAVDI
jgi:hypothetical protein